MEEILRVYRDRAYTLLAENRAQAREGIEILVRERLPEVAAALRAGGAPLSTAQLDALYHQLLDISFTMFSLGYTMAHTVDQPAKSHV
ncbi:hypothetical protein J2Z79_001711 [Symbiobacterium terraclitae]|uniref:Uncharacterized protein n=1 Tax=Symbiobacterium terraclitae TaxID=557451 RepID=A0ABS4JS12_9FIRM|nr:hypothetical protein [Symbiobacterium terraclitae]MBP2018310.1 hypothetical protein [Symbiobacterium terraclitae]